MATCSIVIRAFNEEKQIGRLLEGIMQQTVKDVEIVLVDSGSTDATVAIAQNFPVKIVTIRPEAFTFGYSLNQGIAQTTGEFIVIASAHVYPVYPDWLSRILAPFEDPRVALTYGKQRGAVTTKFSEHQVFARWFPDVSDKRQIHPFCNNANAAIRRAHWEERRYDETLTGLEDLDWAKWALEAGYVLSYAAEAEIIHVHNETPRQVHKRYQREAIAFKHIFPEETFSIWDFVRLTTTNTFSDLWHALRRGAFRANWRSIFWFRALQFWGTYQGYRYAGPVTGQLIRRFYYPRGLRVEETPERDIEPIRYN